MRLRFATKRTLEPYGLFPAHDTLCHMKSTSRHRWSPERSYMASSAITASLSIAFSFLYSRDLGAQNRGIVGMVFLSSLFFSTVALGGLNLTFRSHKLPITTQKHGVVFLLLSVISSFLGALFVMLASSIYSTLKSNVPEKLIYISVIYAFLSIILTQVFQIILSCGLISIRWKLDLLMISIQIIAYLLLRYLDLTSSAISVFIAFITSYAMLLGISVLIIWDRKILKFGDSLYKKRLIELITASKNNIRYSTQMAILDRIDRVVVLIIFPASTFGVYSFMTGVVSFTRFIPESFSTLIVAKKLEGLEGRIHFSSLMRKLTLLVATFLVGGISYIFTKFTFGTTHSVSLWIPLLFTFSELLRGTYISRVSYLVRNYISKVPSHSSLLILLLFTSLNVIFAEWLGLITIPFALVISYYISLRAYRILDTPKVISDKSE